ncbi:hypothetical protein Y1Q_0001541 [Alligator mississippiensis]|uniref:Uncharacterized protein n=1 Tax=Alligator mississippiensis TaxID=8496 RepID=A0A151M9U8_ALLMI|nr:hypothetical protein Y1Q_0001541 [Alligator mississippiensis]
MHEGLDSLLTSSPFIPALLSLGELLAGTLCCGLVRRAVGCWDPGSATGGSNLGRGGTRRLGLLPVPPLAILPETQLGSWVFWLISGPGFKP